MQPYDPYAAQRALAEWAESRKYTLNQTPDVSWYLGWQPFIFVSRMARVGRELRASFDDVGLALVEAFEDDPLKQAAGEDRHVIAFVTSTHLRHRAAIRSKQGAGDFTDIGRGLNALFGGAPQPGAVLGDPAFEQRFDVRAPSREEGVAALPMPLRQLLITSNFRGALEVRQGGMIIQIYGMQFFDPVRLDTATNMLGQAYRAAAGTPS
jgi:hypothetical protein